LTPVASSTPIFTPTPARPSMTVLASDGLRLRYQPMLGDDFITLMPAGSKVYLQPNSEPIIKEGLCWRQVTYTDTSINAGAIAASPDFLNPLADFNRTADQGKPIIYDNALDGWKGRHVGNDYQSTDRIKNPNPPVFASTNGVVINSGTQYRNGKIDGYGNYVLVEYKPSALPTSIRNLPEYNDSNSIYAMYGHLLNSMKDVLPPGTSVTPGMQIGTMGASGNSGGVTHLHLELRFGDNSDKNKAMANLYADGGDWYEVDKLPPMDPALVFTARDTWSGWAAQSAWDLQNQCAAGEPLLGTPQ
jgi:murein DD-endopeptidase MepM/ murein hydrolase activator NlpD